MSLIKIAFIAFSFCITWLFPSSIDGRKFVSLSKQVSIKTNKHFPPHIAFEAMTEKVAKIVEKKQAPEKVIFLSTESNYNPTQDPRPNVTKLVLSPITIVKQKQIIYQAANETVQIDGTGLRNYSARGDIKTSSDEELIDNTWMQDLKPYLRQRIANAAAVGNINSEIASEPESASAASLWVQNNSSRQLQKQIVSGSSNTKLNSNSSVSKKKENGTENTYSFVNGSWVANKTANQAEPEAETNEQTVAQNTGKNDYDGTLVKANKVTKVTRADGNVIVGLLQINDGLAVTNEHHIEVRRYEEGTFQEKGSVNLIQGTYQLELQNPRGFILARLVTSSGKILGEGIGRVSDVKWGKALPHSGPKININKKVDLKGRTVSAYNVDKANAINAKGKVGVFKGYISHELDKSGKVAFDNVVANSATNMVSQVAGHLATQQIVLSNAEFENVVYPQKMIEALKSVVSEQRQQNLNDPGLSVIMGQVLFDKKPSSGVKVQVENLNELEAVYFNSLMLPDSKLKTTSENGYFAFIGAPEDLHHLIALRGENYFGHVNTKVDAGVVSFAKIESSIKTEQVDIKVYDAFQGHAKAAEISMQSLTEKLQVDHEGFQSVYLPSVDRWSLLFANPDNAYQPAYYSYVDKTDYVYVPLISKAWLYQTVSQLKMNIYPSSGIILGFVHDEDFSVEIPNYENLKQNIIYFDYAGRITNQKNGTQGGGFVIFNLPTDVYEVLVVGAKSQKIYSRMAPIKAQDMFVFNFKLDN